MLAYPIHLEPDDNDTLLATSPDFPELVTFGDDRDEALARAVDALEEAIAARIYDREDIPRPSQGIDYAELSTPTAVKAILYQEMRDQAAGKAGSGHNFVWPSVQVSRGTSLNQLSRAVELTPSLGPWAVSRR